MQASTTFDELSEVLTVYFQQLVTNTHVCVTQFYNDDENYKHYFSKHPMIYMFHFIDELCDKYSLEGFNYRYALILSVLTNSFALPEDEAKAGASAACHLGMDSTRLTVEEGWQLGQVIFRLAKRDAEVFSFDRITKQQLDNYTIILLLDHPSRKAASQLERELDLHDPVVGTADIRSSAYQRRLEGKNKVVEELQRRNTGRMESILPQQEAMTASEIRSVVSAGCEEGWRRAKSEGQDDKKALEATLIGGLLNRLVSTDGWSAIAPEMVQALMMEMLPFKFAGSPDECRQALIEYAVWREEPTGANTELVRRSVTAMAEHMRTSGDADFLASLRSLPVAWTKLLPDENLAF